MKIRKEKVEMKRKVLVLSMALLLMVSLLTGCADTKGTQTPPA